MSLQSPQRIKPDSLRKQSRLLSPPFPTYLEGMPKEPVGWGSREVVHGLGQLVSPQQQVKKLEEDYGQDHSRSPQAQVGEAWGEKRGCHG